MFAALIAGYVIVGMFSFLLTMALGFDPNRHHRATARAFFWPLFFVLAFAETIKPSLRYTRERINEVIR